MKFLRNNILEKYNETFENNGYDDLDFIKNMTEVQLWYDKNGWYLWKTWPQSEAFLPLFEIKIQEEAWSIKIKYIMKKSNQCRWNKFGQKMFKSCWFPTPERKNLFLKMICYLNYTEIFITWFYYSNLKIMFYLKDIPVGRLFKKLWVRNHR